MWLTYLLCGLGGGLASFLLDPSSSVHGFLGMSKAATVTVGASGAVFGLYATAVLLKISFNFRKILEAVILGQFVLQQLVQELRSQAMAGAAASGISHAAHLGGALAGVLLILLLSKLPEPGGGKRRRR